MKIFVFFLLAVFSLNANLYAEESKPDKLVILWTSDDPLLAETVAFMYAHEAKVSKWFDEVTIIIWGPSAKLAAENIVIQQSLREMHRDGVVIKACIVCANEFGVNRALENLGFITIDIMGEVLTNYLKSDTRIITF